MGIFVRMLERLDRIETLPRTSKYKISSKKKESKTTYNFPCLEGQTRSSVSKNLQVLLNINYYKNGTFKQANPNGAKT